MNLTGEQLIECYRTMVLIRQFETLVSQGFARGEVLGFVHLGIGQEAVMAGIATALDPGDWVSSTHREHGLLLARGADVNRALAEIFGRATGYCKGKGGSMHLAVLDKHCTGCNGILGSSQTIINGIGFALKYTDTPNVAMVVFGDGAAQRGEFHEGLNLAALWKLPVIFMCINNQYGFSVPTSCSSAVEDIAARASGYCAPGLVVDGNDLVAVYEAVTEARKHAVSGQGPVLVEAKTTRQHGHLEGDTQFYRTPDELAEIKRRDPITRFEKDLSERGILGRTMVEDIWASVEAQMQAAHEFVVSSPYPSPDEIMTDLEYSEVTA